MGTWEIWFSVRKVWCSLFIKKTSGALDPFSQSWEPLCFINIGWIGGATTLLRRFIKKQRAHFVRYIWETLQRKIKILKKYISWISFARRNLQSVFSPLWIPYAASDLVWEASGIPILPLRSFSPKSAEFQFSPRSSLLFHQNPSLFHPKLPSSRSPVKILITLFDHPPAFGEKGGKYIFVFFLKMCYMMIRRLWSGWCWRVS